MFATEGYAPGNLPSAFQIATEPNETDAGGRIAALNMLFGAAADEPPTEAETKSLISISDDFKDEVPRCVTIRRVLQWCLIGITGITAALIVVSWAASLMKPPAWVYVMVGLGFAVLLAIVYGIGLMARRRLNYIFANVWRKSFPFDFK